MLLYLFIEPEYEKSPWCKDILFGLEREMRQKRIAHEVLKSLAKLPKNEIKPSCVIIVGSSFDWMSKAIFTCQQQDAKIVVLSNQPYNLFVGRCSYVCGDIKDSMISIFSYIKFRNKKKIALYAINKSSLSDIGKSESFMFYASEDHSQKDIYINNGSLAECFNNFYKKINQYDAIICANDYAAVSLIQKLKENNYKKLEELLIISYGDTVFAKYYSPEIMTLSINYKDFGKAAITIIDCIQKNPTFSSMHTMVNWEINVRKAANEFEKGSSISYPALKNPKTKNNFFKDPEVAEMLKLENLLNHCDRIDLGMLSCVIKNMSYNEIGEKYFLSVTGIKYRIKKMLSVCDVPSKNELIKLLDKYDVMNNLEKELSKHSIIEN